MAAPEASNSRSGESSWASAAIFSALVALACVLIHLFVTSRAEDELREQVEKRDAFEAQLRLQQQEAERLSVLDSALADDPQTIESGLRRAGLGRKGDQIVRVVNDKPR